MSLNVGYDTNEKKELNVAAAHRANTHAKRCTHIREKKARMKRMQLKKCNKQT